jgi:hypothetical protein
MKKLMVLALAAFAVFAFTGVAAQKVKKPVTFTFDFADFPKETEFYLVGGFQGWATKVPKYKMTKTTGTTYTLTVDIKQGQHQYKYWAPGGGWIIQDMGKYKNRITSPTPEAFVGDGFGGKNATLTVK